MQSCVKQEDHIMIKHVVSQAVKLGVISSENREIYEYGLSNLLYSTIVWSIFLILSILFKLLPSAIFFLIIHIPLRIYAGGLHFSTRFRCFISSLFIFAIVLYLPMNYAASDICRVINFLMIPCFLIVWLFSPVEDSRKPLNSSELSHHRKNSRLICMCSIILYLAFYFLSAFSVSYFIGTGIIVVTFQLLFGRIPCIHRIQNKRL